MIPPALLGINLTAKRLLIQNTQPVLLFKPEHLSKVNFTARVTLISPGLTMGHFPLVTAQPWSRAGPGPRSPQTPRSQPSPSGPARSPRGFRTRAGTRRLCARAAQQTVPRLFSVPSQSCQPQLRENHTCKRSSAQHFHLGQSLR